MAEAFNPVPLQDAAFINPRACEASIEVHTITRIENRLAVDTSVDCGRCTLHESFERSGTEQSVLASIDIVTRSILGRYCLKLNDSGEKPAKIPSDLLPPVIFS